MAKKDTFAMEGRDTLELVEPEAEEQTPDSETASEEKPSEEAAPEKTSFAEAFEKALKDEPIETEPEAEPEPEATDPEPDTKESRSAKDFKSIKEDRDNYKSELDELKTKLATLENSDVDGLMDNLTKERDSLSQQLKLAAIERHPKFQKEYQDKISGIVERSKKLVGEENSERVAELLLMNDSEYRSNGMEEIMVELSTTKQAQLGAMLANLEEVRQNRVDALENSEETYSQIMADQAKQRESVLLDTNKLFDNVAKDAGQLEIFAVRDGQDEWNTEVGERVELARAIFRGENEPEELARASLWAAAGPKYRELLVSQIELNRRLRAQLSEQNGATPSVSTTGTGDSKAEPKGFVDSFMEITGMPEN